MVLLIFIIGAN